MTTADVQVPSDLCSAARLHHPQTPNASKSSLLETLADGDVRDGAIDLGVDQVIVIDGSAMVASGMLADGLVSPQPRRGKLVGDHRSIRVGAVVRPAIERFR